MRVPVALACLSLAACGDGGGMPPFPAPPDPPEPEPPLPVDVAIEQVFTGLDFSAPIAMLQAPGDAAAWYVLERAGRVWRFAADADVTTRTLVLNVTTRVSTLGEGGLLGMALHPQFANNGRMFLSYTAPGAPLESRLAEFFSADGGMTINGGTEQILLTVLQDFSNHNGGHIAFGPDGMLYLGMGDGGSANDPNGRAQDTTNLLGAMLRIDVNAAGGYGIPPDNPLAGNPRCVQGFGGGDCPEIFAWGLRNPWRFSFDRLTGELWAGDVGQNAWEEIDRVESGGNYGWPTREGAHCNPNFGDDDCVTIGFIEPVAEYDHDLGRSITGGFVYRGSDIPGLVGSYVFADYVSGRLWRLEQTGNVFALDELLDTALGIVSFAEDAAGELYLLDLNEGGIYRLIDAG